MATKSLKLLLYSHVTVGANPQQQLVCWVRRDKTPLCSGDFVIEHWKPSVISLITEKLSATFAGLFYCEGGARKTLGTDVSGFAYGMLVDSRYISELRATHPDLDSICEEEIELLAEDLRRCAQAGFSEFRDAVLLPI